MFGYVVIIAIPFFMILLMVDWNKDKKPKFQHNGWKLWSSKPPIKINGLQVIITMENPPGDIPQDLQDMMNQWCIHKSIELLKEMESDMRRWEAFTRTPVEFHEKLRDIINEYIETH